MKKVESALLLILLPAVLLACAAGVAAGPPRDIRGGLQSESDRREAIIILEEQITSDVLAGALQPAGVVQLKEISEKTWHVVFNDAVDLNDIKSLLEKKGILVNSIQPNYRYRAYRK